MQVALINYGHHADLATGGDLLQRYRTLTGWAQGLSAAGARVVVVQGFSRQERIERDGVSYEMVAGPPFVPSLSPLRIPHRLHFRIRRYRPDVVHLNGLAYPLQTRALRWLLPRSCALVAQFHAEGPKNGLKARVQSWGLGVLDGFIFTARDQAAPYWDRGLIRPHQPIFEIVEGSSDFQMAERGEARRRSGLDGGPIFLWVGHLNSNKDPLCVIEGFEAALEGLPRARLYMVFIGQELLPRVRDRLDTSSALRQAVVLVGAVAHPDLELLFNSADFFVLGSHHEGSGYALVEAMSCGVVPVVTDIPSYRFITDGGTLGALWPPGDPRALSRAILKLADLPLQPQRQAVRAFFDRRLSYAAIGRQALTVYRRLQQKRQV